jgi:hypothetical protein
MLHDQFVAPHGAPFDIDAIRQFWHSVLRRIKVYAESSEAVGQSTVDATGDPEDSIDGDDGSCEGDGG